MVRVSFFRMMWRRPTAPTIDPMHIHHPPQDPAAPPRAPGIIALQVAMQALFAGLLGLVVVRSLLAPDGRTVRVVVLSAVLLVLYVAVLLLHGMTDPRRRAAARLVGLALMAAVTLMLVWATVDAAYLLFPLSFLFLEHLPPRPGTASVCLYCLAVVILIGGHDGWTVGGVVGPVAASGVAIIVGLTVRAWRDQARQAQMLYRDLLKVQDQLARSEREAGVLAERSRLAREIHDTVSQSLSSIALLLNAAERADPDGAALDQIRLARETASASLAETRRFIKELTPPQLDEQSLPAALRRLAATQWSSSGLSIEVRAADPGPLPMPVQAALLRVAQGAMANVVGHARADRAVIELAASSGGVGLTVADDGIGMDTAAVEGRLGRGEPDDARPGVRGSFGLRAIRERVAQLGGTLSLESSPGRGTRLRVWLPVDSSREGRG